MKKIALLTLAASLFAATEVTLSVFPKPMQLFARDAHDSGIVRISGSVVTTGKDSAIVLLYRNNALYGRTAVQLGSAIRNASFDVTVKIHAELSQYKVKLFIDADSVCQADSLVCGDAYILDGQSNAAAEAYTGYTSPFIRSFGAQSFDSTNIDTGWGMAQPAPQINWQRKNVIGLLGMAIARRIVEDGKIPVAIFNGAIGGTPIDYHFRSTALSSIYGRLLFRVVQAGLKDGLRGVIWHQGEASYSGPDLYMTHFKRLHGEWLSDFPGIQRVYVFQIRPGCNYDGQDIIRETHRRLPDTLPDVRVMATTSIPMHDGCHYDSSGYRVMGERMAKLIGQDFYGSADTVNITPPNIVSARFRDTDKRVLDLLFTQAVQFNIDTINPLDTTDTVAHAMAEGFSLGKNWSMVDSVTVDTAARTVSLFFKARCDSMTVSYTPDRFYTGTTRPYEGPWLFNNRGVGALTFYRFPISISTREEPAVSSSNRLSLTAEPNPFNPSTVISFSSMPGSATLRIFDVRGTLVKTFVYSTEALGINRVVWDATNEYGKKISAGLYFISLSCGGKRFEKRVIYCP